MTRLIIAALALALTACAGAAGTVNSAGTIAAGTADAIGVAPPATHADRTVLDEQGMMAVELAYRAARVAVETGVDAGIIRGATASRFAALDRRAYAAVGVVRAAYRAGNAPSYRNALSEAQAAISGLLALTSKGT